MTVNTKIPYAASVSSVADSQPPQFDPPPVEPVQQGQPTTSQNGNGRFRRASSKAGWPLNKAANLIGAEGWWPATTDKECLKAARILHSFTNLRTDDPPSTSGPKHLIGITRKAVVKIPPSVLRNCAGLAIFNTLRAGGFHGSLAAGSGVVITRRGDGTWSPPSLFVVSSLGAGFVFGLNVYDCICVLNTPAQVEAFTNPRLTLGGEASVTAGPVGVGGSYDASVAMKASKPVWSYTKSRGVWAGVQVDGTIFVSRSGANAALYGDHSITPSKILRGDVAWPMAARPLFEVLRALDGQAFVDPEQMVGDLTTNDVAVDEKQMSILEDIERPVPCKDYVEEEKTKEYYSETADEEKRRLAESGY